MTEPYIYRPLLLHCLPPSTLMTEPSANCYQLRLQSGEYDRITTNLLNFKKHALDPKKGFRAKTTDDKYTPFSTWIFGEIASCSLGTLHQASGNHFIGWLPVHVQHLSDAMLTYTTTSTNLLMIQPELKMSVFMLKTPTNGSRELTHLFDYQLTVLNSIWLVDEQSEQQNKIVCFYIPTHSQSY